MFSRRRVLTFTLAAPAAFATAVAGTGAHAEGAAKIYLGFPPGSTVHMTAALIAEALGKQLKLPYRDDARAGNFTKFAMDAFRKDAADESKLILTTPSPDYPAVADLQLIAVVGDMRDLPAPFGLYADRKMPAAKAEAIRKVVEKLVSDRIIPR